MMKITGLSHLFKWENLHNWWLTKYFFAPLYIYIYIYVCVCLYMCVFFLFRLVKYIFGIPKSETREFLILQALVL